MGGEIPSSSAIREWGGSPRAERWWVLALTLLALALRTVGLARLGLEHFDEGVYALSGLWPWRWPEGLFYVGQHYYAPWLLPWLIGAAYQILGVSDLAAISANLLAGTLTVPLIWWVGRRWYGPAAGRAAACLAALSDLHILYSRMALTDVLLTAWFLAAVGVLGESLRRGSWRFAVAAGVLTTLAWNTKYNGWLPLLVGLVVLVPVALTHGFRSADFRRRLGCWGLAAAIAGLGYLPWFLYVQEQPGGYAALMDHHHRHLEGWAQWPTNLQTYATMLWILDGWGSRLAPAVAWAVSIAGAGLWSRRGAPWVVTIMLILAGAGLYLSGTVLMLVLALAALPAVWRRPSGPRWMHVSWLGWLLVLTPLYHPYSRLSLPWMAGLWLAAGAAVGSATLGSSRWLMAERGRDLGKKWPVLVTGTVTLVLIGLVIVRPPRVPVRTWHPTDDFRQAAIAIAKDLPADALLLVYAEPPLLFYLSGRAVPIAELSDLEPVDLDSRSRYLILGPHAQRDPQTEQFLRDPSPPHLRLVKRYWLQPSDVVVLEWSQSSEWTETRRSESWQLEVYEFVSRPSKGTPSGN